MSVSICRTVLLIRHGQHLNDVLTSLGRAQARRTGQALCHLKPPKIYCSTSPRALETAKILASILKSKPISKSFFCEGFLPGESEFREISSKRLSKKERLLFQRRAKAAANARDDAFDFAFRIPKSRSSCIIIVAHGNIIRHWLCKALHISADNWKFFAVAHASVTSIRRNDQGQFVVLGVSDVGHLPQKARTYL